MQNVTSICVYCGSGSGKDPRYEAAAIELGQTAASLGIRIVYGGGNVGLMGATATACAQAGGKVTGIIPDFLIRREGRIEGLDEVIVTDTMHQRKTLMFEKSDGFVVLPGGLGTLEETAEIMTWFQLGQHQKPIILANIAKFWEPLIALLDHMREDAFIRPELEVSFGVASEISEVFPQLEKMAETFKNTDTQTGDGKTQRPSLGSM